MLRRCTRRRYTMENLERVGIIAKIALRRLQLPMAESNIEVFIIKNKAILMKRKQTKNMILLNFNSVKSKQKRKRNFWGIL